ncbi:cytochrome b562 [Gilvimarinus sp. SDUM040013]|uniref:Cytochrome b562 n=1 Tax=Gilvimarinus gilvus TaxID=3058038 RepID=A0ABU4RTS0_9GAMM|nr:cytochrome b562 [Gilvimarinus sp. SDUM040013]MDO3386790.1 cytochrome b562 [Gilvimarinus sp. SDUM040013]MDX6848280.1 cytochrome b562 [Gilvimarinus sp. SDUM040013]
MKKLMIVLLLPLLAVACSKHDPLHESMESMGDSFKAMRESDDLVEVQAQWQSFKEALDIAQAQTMGPEEQADFEHGMQELAELTQALDAALAAKDLAAAKASLKKLGEVRKEYHDKLKVD